MMNERARAVLISAYRQRGPELYQDARLCRNLLNDMCGDCHTEVRVLSVAAEEGIVQGLELQLRHQPRPTVVAAAVATLARRAALREDAARWAVESWIIALEPPPAPPGVVSRDELYAPRSWEAGNEISQNSFSSPAMDSAMDSSMDSAMTSATSANSVQRLNEDSSLELVVTGEWLYYLNENDNRSIYRIRTGGGERQKLNEDCSSGLVLSGGWLYYINGSDRNSIYRLAPDGGVPQKLNDDWSADIVVAGDWLYFIERGRPCRMRTDGSGRQNLNQDRSRDIKVHGDWMYYINRSDRNRIYRMRNDAGMSGESNDLA